MTKFEGLYS